jgi:hypothetical protein
VWVELFPCTPSKIRGNCLNMLHRVMHIRIIMSSTLWRLRALFWRATLWRARVLPRRHTAVRIIARR